MFETFSKKDFTPGNVCIWTGAGISADYPSNLPLGNGITKSFIDACCLDNTWEKLLCYFRNTHMHDSLGNPKIAPRLEAVLENIIEIYGTGILRAFNPLYFAPANSSHYLFAKHLINGGIHITTNFDNCIQCGLEKINTHASVHTIHSIQETNDYPEFPLERTIIHIHGKYYPDKDNLEYLGLRISKIANGILGSVDKLLKTILSNTSYIIFFGYSGSDYFDINPFFYNLHNQEINLSHVTTIWVNHKYTNTIERITDWKSNNRNGKAILEGMENAGGKIIYYDANTTLFLKNLCNLWNLEWVDTEKEESSLEKHSIDDELLKQKQTTISERTVCTAQIFSFMGIGKEVVGLEKKLLSTLSRKSPNYSKVVFLISNGFRDIGFYKRARFYSKKLSNSEPNEKVFREGRLAGDYWLMGANLLAVYHFFIGYFFFKFSAVDNYKKGTYEEFLLDYLHWYRDIARTSVLKFIIPLSSAVKAFEYLINNPSYLFIKPHSLSKLSNLYREIPGICEKVDLPQWSLLNTFGLVSVFQETDSILGVINFTRRKLYSDFIINKILPSRKDLVELLDMSKYIDDRSGILKIAMYLKKYFNTTYPGVLHTLFEIEWTITKKISWLIDWLGSKSSHR